MDQALVAYFDERFRVVVQQMQHLNGQMQHLDGQMQQFREETLHRFEQVDARIERRFGEAMVVLEDVRHQVQLVAEGYQPRILSKSSQNPG